MNKIVVIATLTVLLTISAGVGAYVYFNTNNGETAKAPKPDDRPFIYVEVPPVVTNFNVKGKTRYLQITVSLQTRDITSSNTFKTNLPLIQSTLLSLMQSSRYQEITSIEGKTEFVDRIESHVLKLFKANKAPIELERAMLTGFVVQ